MTNENQNAKEFNLKFSAQEEYGLRCVLQIARLRAGESLTIPEISKREGLSSTHVAKMLMILRRDGFIASTRGQSGGYTLARLPAEIRVGDVLASLGGRLYDDDFCEKHSGVHSPCAHSVDCTVRGLWQVIQSAVDQAVGEMTLLDLIEPKSASRNVQMFDLPQRLQPVS